MVKIETIVFSFNRPAQLDLLLESIVTFDISKFLAVYIQYSYSNDEFKKGYEILKRKYLNFSFIEERRYIRYRIVNPLFGSVWFNFSVWITNYRFRKVKSNFRELLLKLIKQANERYLMFLADDSLFIREIEISPDVLSNINNNHGSAFSLVLGKNVLNGNYISHGEYIESQTVQRPFYNIWNYPFSVDGRVYETKFFYSLINKTQFTNPNTFEAVMVAYNRFSKAFNKIYANNVSSLIGFELNRVQQTYANNNINIDPNEINKYFLEGHKLVIEYNHKSMDSFRPSINRVEMEKGEETVTLYSKGNKLL